MRYAPLLMMAVLAAGSAHADVAYSLDSVAKGKALFLNNCTACHGNNGKSQVDVISDATDLTEPLLYRHGVSDSDIETSIRSGRGGVMPAWGSTFKPDDIAHLRNFVKSLWPEDKRPKPTETAR